MLRGVLLFASGLLIGALGVGGVVLHRASATPTTLRCDGMGDRAPDASVLPPPPLPRAEAHAATVGAPAN